MNVSTLRITTLDVLGGYNPPGPGLCAGSWEIEHIVRAVLEGWRPPSHMECFHPWRPANCYRLRVKTGFLKVSIGVLSIYCSRGSQGEKSEVVFHSLLQWTTCCQNSPAWPVRLGWPYMAWLLVSLSWTRWWSMWSVWLVFCDCGFHSVCPLMDKDKRLMEDSLLGNY